MKKSGFTLIELLVVVAIIAILAAAVFVAVNPARRFAEANNAKRWSDITAVLNAVLTYSVDNRGTLPTDLTAVDTGTYVLGTGGTCSTCTATTTTGASPCINLASALVSDYISSIPQDPTNGSAGDTQYYIYRAGSGVITVGACNPDSEGGTVPTVQVAR